MSLHEAPVSVAGEAWLEHMRRGNFPAAWEISDAVLRAHAGQSFSHWPRHEQPIWDGTPLAGRRVLIRCYHGLGDTVQFIRYAPLVKSIARVVTVWAQPALLPLLRDAAGIDRLLPLHEGAPDALYDVDVEVMELPHIFRTTLETVPATVPYLYAPSAALPRTSESNTALNVGIAWEAGDWDPRRSIPLRLLEPLWRIPNVRFHALQRGSALADWPIAAGPRLESDHLRETASAIRALDLVLSIDSLLAHVAGALGAPVWTLLHADPDWRWMVGREDSPWYPTMRLFRQPRAGEWAPVIARVAAELAALAATKFNARRITVTGSALAPRNDRVA